MITVGWVLNLDADLELVAPAAFTPSRRQVAQTELMADRLLRDANARSQRVRHVRLASGQEHSVGQAWCATPRAHAEAEATGHALPKAPAVAVLQRVNHRAFAAGFGLCLPDAAFATSMQELDAVLQAASPQQGWLLKRPLGFSGRGQKRVTSLSPGADRRWAEASMSGYGCGVMVEPFVTIDEEFALHSWLGRDGQRLTGQATRLVTNELGAWVASEPRAELPGDERDALHAAHEVAAQSLVAAGYFGPFSTDAFRYRDDHGQLRFHALSELNARYSMGFFAGFADHSEQWVERVVEQA